MSFERHVMGPTLILLTLVVCTQQIVKGRLARRCQIPYIAYVRGYAVHERLTCGGTLLDERHVVTAAHCVDDDRYAFFVLFGSTDSEEMSIRIPVMEIIKHENFSRSPEVVNDVAILKLSRPVQLSKCLQTLELAAPNDVLLTNCSIAGWGRTTIESPISPYLFYAKVPLLTFDRCHHLNPTVTGHNVCAGQFAMDTQTTCEGDSGGPLVCRRKRDGHNVLVGIVSYGWDCRDGLSVFSRVSFYKDWILRTILMKSLTINISVT